MAPSQAGGHRHCYRCPLHQSMLQTHPKPAQDFNNAFRLQMNIIAYLLDVNNFSSLRMPCSLQIVPLSVRLFTSLSGQTPLLQMLKPTIFCSHSLSLHVLGRAVGVCGSWTDVSAASSDVPMEQKHAGAPYYTIASMLEL